MTYFYSSGPLMHSKKPSHKNTQGKTSWKRTSWSKKLCLSALCLSAAVLIPGCASTATGAKQSALVGISQTETLKSEAPDGSVFAIIRYPAVVETAAKDAYYKAFESSSIGGRKGSGRDGAEIENIADSVIVKSNYFALSLFKEMAARLPEHSTLLSPHAIKLDANGKLTSEPITKAENLPSSVRTDHRAAAPTQGVLFASAPLIPFAAGTGQMTARQSMGVMQTGQFDTQAPELDFISYISKDARLQVPTQTFRARFF